MMGLLSRAGLRESGKRTARLERLERLDEVVKLAGGQRCC